MSEPINFNVTILPDQLELLEKIRLLPKVIEEHLGKFPQSFPSNIPEIDRIKELCEALEFKWKKWIFETIVTSSKTWKILDGVVLRPKITRYGEIIEEDDGDLI